MSVDDLQIPAQQLSSFVRKFLPNQSWKKITISTLPFDTGSSSYCIDDGESNVRVIVELNQSQKQNDVEGASSSKQEENNNEDGSIASLSNINNNQVEDAIISFILSNKGWGPKLLGVGYEGKILDYFEGECLTPDLASDANTIRDIAVGYARFHSIGSQVPFARDKMSGVKKFLLQESSQPHNFVKVSRILSETLRDLDENFVKELNKFKLEDEVKWLLQTYREIPVKSAFIRFQNSFEHVLIRERSASSSTSASATTSFSANPLKKSNTQRRKEVIFSNHSQAMFGPRGIDLGGHFINRMINWAHKENKINEEVFPPVDERGLFAREYLDELQSLDPNTFNLDGMDNEGQILMEADLGALFYALYSFTQILSNESSWQTDPAIVTLLPFFHEFYTRYKLFCKKKYTHWP